MRILMLPVLLSSLMTASPHQYILVIQKQFCNEKLLIDFYEVNASKEECNVKIKEFTFTTTDVEEYTWAACFDELPNPPENEIAAKAFIDQLDMGVIIEPDKRRECYTT